MGPEASHGPAIPEGPEGPAMPMSPNQDTPAKSGLGKIWPVQILAPLCIVLRVPRVPRVQYLSPLGYSTPNRSGTSRLYLFPLGYLRA
jgi:hypothetical protein